MPVDHTLRQFIEGPVMLIVGSVDGDGRTGIGRASGARVDADDSVTLFVSHWQWPETIANLRANPRMSLTATSPATYDSFQIKGHATVQIAPDTAVALADRYIDATYRLMTRLGVPTTSESAWFSNRELWEVKLTATEVFIQTPGPQAGLRRAGA